MIFKGNLDIDTRGLIYESYRIEGITIEECRTIFLDWAMMSAPDGDVQEHLVILLNEYSKKHPSHPMTEIIIEGIENSSRKGPRKRGSR